MWRATQEAIAPSFSVPVATRSVRSASPSPLSIARSTVRRSRSGRKPQPSKSWSTSRDSPGSARSIRPTARWTSSEPASAATSAPSTTSADAGMADIPATAATRLAASPPPPPFESSLQPAAALRRSAAAAARWCFLQATEHAAGHAGDRLADLLQLRAGQAELHHEVLVHLLDDRLLRDGVERGRQRALHLRELGGRHCGEVLGVVGGVEPHAGVDRQAVGEA